MLVSAVAPDYVRSDALLILSEFLENGQPSQGTVCFELLLNWRGRLVSTGARQAVADECETDICSQLKFIILCHPDDYTWTDKTDGHWFFGFDSIK